MSRIVDFKFTLSKCPGCHLALHWGLKLNSKSEWGKIKKKFSGASYFSTGELSKNFQNNYLNHLNYQLC